MKIAISGGHLSPALAVIEALPKIDEVVFIGRKHPFENDSVTSLEYLEISKRNIRFLDLQTGKLHRKVSHRGVLSLMKLPKGFFSAISILQKEKPDVVVSFGGYIGLPLVYSAKFLHIPSVIHEQTLEAGFSNKLAGKVASRICISWEESRDFFPKSKIVLTGNPLRKEILNALEKKNSKQKLPLLYITGGSTGSHEVNLLVQNHLERLLDSYEIIHQTGDAKEFNDASELTKLVGTFSTEKQKRYMLQKFTSPQQAAEYMSKADMVIGRSGMNTISELLYLQKKSLLIPLRHGQIGEQMTNAIFLRKMGLSEIYEYPEDFVDTINKMIASDAYKLKKPFDTTLFTKAADTIVQIIHETSKTQKV